MVSFIVSNWYLKRREESQGIAAGNILQKVAVCLAQVSNLYYIVYKALRLTTIVLTWCLFQVLALPLGVQLGKVFWCNETTNQWNVANDVVCWTGLHIMFVVVSLVILIVFYPLYAFWLYRQIRSQVSSTNQI